ncbi:MAG: hypothetical protein FWG77_05495 [Treponema sp.]|nr:hypothetical protein [Treponema sp.]
MNIINYFVLGLLFIPTAFFCLIVHELGHWSTGKILGYKMRFGLNIVKTIDVDKKSILFTIGGLFFTILLSLGSWVIIEIYKINFVYMFIFFNFIMRLGAQIINFKLQDESIISAHFNLKKYTIAIIVNIILLAFTLRSGFILGYNFIYHTVCLIGSLIGMISVIYIDQYLWKIR